MKYCEQCKLNVHGSLDNCPLCGSYLNKAGEGYDRYEREIEPRVSYPELVVKDNVYRSLLTLKALLLITIAAAVCILINIALYRGSLWSGYVAVGGLVGYLCAISAVYRKRRFYAQIAIDAFVLSIAAFALDMIYTFDVAGNLSLFGYSLEYIVPALLAAAVVTTDVMIFTDRGYGKYYLVTLLFVSLIALVPQTVVWLNGTAYAAYLTFPLFFFALTNGLVLTIVCWKRIKREIRHKFFL